MVYLTIEGETLVTTADHPFYTVAGEWVEAGDLRLGDDIRMASWATGDVESVYIVTQPQPMYNFTVATAHTYFVGEHQWLVHNDGPLTPPKPSWGEELIQQVLNGTLSRDQVDPDILIEWADYYVGIAPTINFSDNLPTQEFNIYRAEYLLGHLDQGAPRSIHNFRDNILPSLGDYLGGIGC